ncbi:hypothetical protein KO507_18970 [Gilvimarinus agarilyticus]|uniref:DUF6445 family protein n=1 Tax=unclassified Gilvimarinus TaxID=2642066 RepID=UPI001C0977F2|nr:MULTISPECIES: DUF6445 family protein [unclassified Gilvimarinus]MBU2887854.1 hypothetical protein [Gilvimarinus agarilyticus]MDO6572492.1 DUF6445 family protein [Gilvimarinus sp. 2_MG-2023]MDO6746632.1 DUF6445 family protein [Gilvimarinus sp. 1_MG-2023]
MIKIKQPLVENILLVGQSKTPVIVIDDFGDSLHGLRVVAQDYARFTPAQGGYPGCRAVLPSSYGSAVLSVLQPLIQSVYSLPDTAQGRCYQQFFSLVTKRPSELSTLQRLPHFDSDVSRYFAVMHYLGDGDFGGTGFFRHKASGVERVKPDNRSVFIESVRGELKQSEPAHEYIAGSNDRFEMTASVEYRVNRLMVYPGNLLHSGLINTATDINHCPLTGRLTANIFVDFS